MPAYAYDATMIMNKFAEHPMQMLPLMVLAMGFGFVQYIFCFFMTMRDKKSPFPAYMHAFYLAHDFLFVTLFHQWFVEYKSLPFQVVWLGMVAFNFFELHALYLEIKYDRQESFGKYYDGPVTVWQATKRLAVMVIVSFIILSTVRSFMNDKLMFCVFISTNVIMAIGPALLMQQRRKRVRGSAGLACFILLGTIATFLPEGLGMYTTADPEYFARPWFFILGATCTLIAILHLVTVLRMPKPAAAR
ncbi:hypothetical protein HSX37_08960|uniref:Uncharacterized protein n=1 Tax=Dendrosporobacter quercicolus TaxID=146817 RepID=A0A1G9QAE3_9FIRM|nr:hypothetical protein [Dendrosporobacter quercicolus]NSL48156.1 hypothetical protein [Dendrosporobacter quercicolus DSM 1736]SDM07447.1 hypothetical protein SAMN04488502_10283 [Dendrosporobacter quercicolus]